MTFILKVVYLLALRDAFSKVLIFYVQFVTQFSTLLVTASAGRSNR